MKIKALPGKVLVNDIKRGERKVGSIILPNDDGKAEGVRCRWCQVYSVGEDIDAIKAGEWILVKHGNWTRGIRVTDEATKEVTELWSVNWPDGVLAATDNPTETWSGDQTVTGTDVSQLNR
jgi:hypothetical protein